jgi:DNA polymerase I-like protein with 3'-5' exonuclease and polymerase domains
MCACDYSSEEFLIAALESGDKKMVAAYLTGDPYLAFAKDAKAAPASATKKSHGKIRTRFKSTVLGVSYLMGAKALARKLTADTGIPHTEEEAQELIDLFAEAYSTYDDYRSDIVEEYYYEGYLMLDDGWMMGPDNDNFRSIANMPIQGMGAVVLRKAVKYVQEAGLEIALTLHDAIYVEHDSDDLSAVDTLVECMLRAFKDCYEGSPMQDIANIRVDADVWGPDFKGLKSVTTPKGLEVKAQEIYIDGRAITEYEAFSPYFENNVEELCKIL